MEEKKSFKENALERIKTFEGMTYAEWELISEIMDGVFKRKIATSSKDITVSIEDVTKTSTDRLFRL